MKCASHYSIADKIFNDLINPIYPKYKEELRNGSVHPDKEGVSIPHYNGRENDIELFIRKFMFDRIAFKYCDRVKSGGSLLCQDVTTLRK